MRRVTKPRPPRSPHCVEPLLVRAQGCTSRAQVSSASPNPGPHIPIPTVASREARQASSCGVPFPPPHWRLSQSSTSTHAPYITGTNVGRAAGGESGRHKPFQARRVGSDQMVGCVTGPPSASLGWPLANGPHPDQAEGGWGRAAADWTRARRDGGWGPAHPHLPHSVLRTRRR